MFINHLSFLGCERPSSRLRPPTLHNGNYCHTEAEHAGNTPCLKVLPYLENLHFPSPPDTGTGGRGSPGEDAHSHTVTEHQLRYCTLSLCHHTVTEHQLRYGAEGAARCTTPGCGGRSRRSGGAAIPELGTGAGPSSGRSQRRPPASS